MEGWDNPTLALPHRFSEENGGILMGSKVQGVIRSSWVHTQGWWAGQYRPRDQPSNLSGLAPIPPKIYVCYIVCYKEATVWVGELIKKARQCDHRLPPPRKSVSHAKCLQPLCPSQLHMLCTPPRAAWRGGF